MNKEQEIEVVELMIRLYCKKNHRVKGKELCIDCQDLLNYVKERRCKCPWGDEKPFCANCVIHCYKSDMREKIRSVMRYSGPRMIFSHPILSIKHLIETKKQKNKLQKYGLDKLKAEGLAKLAEKRKNNGKEIDNYKESRR